MANFENIYLTGDTHGDFTDLITKSIRYRITERDLLIILGDVGINYFGDYRDQKQKDLLCMIPATILCIRGNHELRPTSPVIANLYRRTEWMGDFAYVEDAYPRFIMAEDGARYRRREAPMPEWTREQQTERVRRRIRAAQDPDVYPI